MVPISRIVRLLAYAGNIAGSCRHRCCHMPATLLAYADNLIYLILWANRYVISDDIIYELKYGKQAFLSSLRYLSVFTADTFIYQCI